MDVGPRSSCRPGTGPSVKQNSRSPEKLRHHQRKEVNKMKLQMMILTSPAELVEYVNNNHIKRENIQYIRTYSDSNYIDLIYWVEEK